MGPARVDAPRGLETLHAALYRLRNKPIVLFMKYRAIPNLEHNSEIKITSSRFVRGCIVVRCRSLYLDTAGKTGSTILRT